MKITIDISDIEYAILKTHLVSPEEWVENALRDKIRKCANRVFEANTGRIAARVAMRNKLTELDKLDMKPRTDKDARPKLKHKEKDLKK